MKITLGEWLPDLPELENPGALLVKNAIPLATSYRDISALSPFAPALDARARGWFWIKAKSGGLFNFAGDLDKLYLYSGVTAAYEDVSQAATTYNADAWDFVSFQERVLCTDGGASPIQYFDVGVPSTTFDDLPGSPPLCKCLGVVRDFVLAGNYEIGSEIEPGGFAWCGFNNTEMWTPSLSTQAGRQRSRGAGGALLRIVSGTEGLLFRENAVQVVNYVGLPTVFKVDDIATSHGTPSGMSVCWNKEFVFYLSNEGFMQLQRSTRQLTPIGQSKVDEYFRKTAAPSELRNVRGTIDRQNSLVYWQYKTSSSNTQFNRMLIYYWPAKRWAVVEMDIELVMEFASIGYNLDTIGALLGGNIDSASINVDDPQFKGGAVTLTGFNPEHRASNFTGEPLVAEIDTAEFSEAEGERRLAISGVRPIVEGGNTTVVHVAPLPRNDLNTSPAVGNFVARHPATGRHDMRINARYHRFRLRIEGGFKHARGVNLQPKKRGRQ